MSVTFCIESYPLCGLKTTLSNANAAEIEALISRFGMNGWVQRTGSVHTVGATMPSTELVVAADLVENPLTSHRVRRVGDSWRLWTYTEVTGERTHRRQQVTHVGIGEVESLEYCVYWQRAAPLGFEAHGVHPWRPIVDRLTAIRLGKGRS